MSIFKNNFLLVITIFFLLYGVFFNYLFLYFFLGIFFFIIFKFRSTYLFFIISIIFLSFFTFELIFKDKETYSDYFTKNNITYEIDKNYGYHPTKNKIFNEEILYKNKLFKKNIYSINKYGHRSFDNKLKLQNCIIFHGGSITFGQSLSDDETLPFFLGKLHEKNFNIFNFAFNGYGPHQFLAKLESLKQDEINHCKNVTIIYQFIYDHIARSVGKRSWGDKSPRYIVKNEQLIKKGFFSDFPFKFIMKLRKNFRHSKISNILFNLEKINKKDELIFLNILKNIELSITQKFVESKFIYLVWDKNLNESEKLYDFFEYSNVIFINDKKFDKKILYNNIPGDNHPTKQFNILISNEIKNML